MVYAFYCVDFIHEGYNQEHEHTGQWSVARMELTEKISFKEHVYYITIDGLDLGQRDCRLWPWPSMLMALYLMHIIEQVSNVMHHQREC